MTVFRKSYILVLFGGALLCTPEAAQAADASICNQLLSVNLRTDYDELHEQDIKAKTAYDYCHKTYDSLKEDERQSASFAIESFWADATGNKASGKTLDKSHMDELCTKLDSEFRKHNFDKIGSSKVGEPALAAWTSCIKALVGSGVGGSFLLSPSERFATFTLSVDGTGLTAHFRGVEIEDPKTLKCRGQRLEDGAREQDLTGSTKIDISSGQRWTITCTRSASPGAQSYPHNTVVVKTDSGAFHLHLRPLNVKPVTQDVLDALKQTREELRRLTAELETAKRKAEGDIAGESASRQKAIEDLMQLIEQRGITDIEYFDHRQYRTGDGGRTCIRLFDDAWNGKGDVEYFNDNQLCFRRK